MREKSLEGVSNIDLNRIKPLNKLVKQLTTRYPGTSCGQTNKSCLLAGADSFPPSYS